jgi:hypothetical protein
MENEKFQDLVLNHLARLTQEITELKSGQQKIESDINNFKQTTQDRFDRIEKKLDTTISQTAGLVEFKENAVKHLQAIK